MQPSILITAFEPFGTWTANSSQLCLQELQRRLPAKRLAFRTYPVDFTLTRELLREDLAAGYDLAIHLGQAQQTGRVRLEAIAVNIGGVPGQPEGEQRVLEAAGPVAYSTSLSLPPLGANLRAAGIPAYVSYHAGTYLCNAVFYWSRHFASLAGAATQSCLIHLPLDVSQAVAAPGDWPTLPTGISAAAVQRAIEQFADDGTRQA